MTPSAQRPAPLRVAVLTRTGRKSGMQLAAAIEASGHTLVGILAEQRTTMIWKSWKRRSPLAFMRRYGLGFLVRRALQSLVARLRPSPLRTQNHTAPDTLPTIVASLNSDAAIDQLRDWQPDILLVANAPILKAAVFETCGLCAINFHSGRLPDYGGVESEFWVLYEQQPTASATLHRVEAALDSGDILDEATIPITPDDTPDTLHARLLDKACDRIAPLLDKISACGITPIRTPGPATLRQWPTPAQRRTLRARKAG